MKTNQKFIDDANLCLESFKEAKDQVTVIVGSQSHTTIIKSLKAMSELVAGGGWEDMDIEYLKGTLYKQMEYSPVIAGCEESAKRAYFREGANYGFNDAVDVVINKLNDKGFLNNPAQALIEGA